MSEFRVARFRTAANVIGAFALILAGTAHAFAADLGQITSPAPGSTLTGSTVTFTWSAGAITKQYYLSIGNSVGAADIYFVAAANALGAVATNLPTDGRTVYVRLSSSTNNGLQVADYTYTAAGSGGGGGGGNCNAPAPAGITSPAAGSTLSGASVTFQWSAGSCVTSYTLSVGTSAGATNIYTTNLGLGLSATVNGLPTNGTTVFVRLSSLINGTPQNVDYTYTAASGSGSGCGVAAAATLTSPTNGSTLPGASATFTWTSGCQATQYTIYVGTVVGGSDIYFQGQGLNLTTTIGNLPTDGRTLYLRLWSLVNSSWISNDYTFTAAASGSGCGTPAPGAITLPTNGSVLSGSTVTFQWTAGACVSSFTLSIGNTLGGADIYSQVQGTNLSVSVGGLPTDGRAIFVRLSSLINGVSQTADYTYTAGNSTACGTPTPGALTGPPNGSTLTGSSATFTWSAGCAVFKFFLYVGNSTGTFEWYSQDQLTGTTATVTGLPTDGRALHVRLWSYVQSSVGGAFGWTFTDYTFTAFSSGGGCGTPAQAAITSPANMSTLTGSSVVFTWTTGTCVSQYILTVGSAQGLSDIYGLNLGNNTTATVNNLPTNGSMLFVRLSSMINGVLQFTDYTYTAFTINLGCNPAAKATMTTPAGGSTLTGSSATFTWGTGCQVTQYYLYVGNAAATNDIYGQSQATNLTATVNNLPTDGRTIYVRLWSLIGGVWQFNDYTYTAFTNACGSPAPATITTPANGSTLVGSSVPFTWTAGSCVTEYILAIGNTAGGTDYFGASQGTNLTVSVAGLPTDGRTLQVRLSSRINGVLQFNDYTYQASQASGCGTPTPATLTSPANGSMLTGPSVALTWSAGCGVSKYYLFVGTAVGLYDLGFLDEGTALSTTVNNLPTAGQTLYFRLWSLLPATSDVNFGWQFHDYTFVAFH